jgi:hypothetical protein
MLPPILLHLDKVRFNLELFVLYFLATSGSLATFAVTSSAIIQTTGDSNNLLSSPGSHGVIKEFKI